MNVHFRGGDGGEGVMVSPSHSAKAGHVDVYRRRSEIKYLPRGVKAGVCLSELRDSSIQKSGANGIESCPLNNSHYRRGVPLSPFRPCPRSEGFGGLLFTMAKE